MTKDLALFKHREQVEVVLRGIVGNDFAHPPYVLVEGVGRIYQSVFTAGGVVEVRAVPEPPKPDYDEGDLVLDGQGYLLQKAPVGAEDEAGEKATESDGFWLLHSPYAEVPTPAILWFLNDMDFPVTRIPKERLL